MHQKKYKSIISHYESCLEKYGDTHLGVDWPKAKDVDIRYEVMLQVIKPIVATKTYLLDFGCGASHLYEYINRNNLLDRIDYSGLDLSEKFISLSKLKFPNINYYCQDILEKHTNLPEFDYIIMNGIFTEKCDLSFIEMFSYFKKTLARVYTKSRIGLAFNVMSKHVDYERSDLFHLPFDLLTNFITKNLTRNFIIRHDYGLYEYTVYVYK
jgi:SAM-dependent methyltransferase